MKKMKLMFYVIFAFMLIIPLGVKAEPTTIDENVSIECEGSTITAIEDTDLDENTNKYYDVSTQLEENGGNSIVCKVSYPESADAKAEIAIQDGSGLVVPEGTEKYTSSEGIETYEFAIKYNGVQLPSETAIVNTTVMLSGKTYNLRFNIVKSVDKNNNEGGNSGGQSGEQGEKGSSTNTVPSTKEETSVNPDTADMNIVQLSVLLILFAGIAVLSYKKVIKNNN